MTTLALVLLSGLLVVGGLAAISALAARRIEEIVPPQGRFLDLDGERIHFLDKGGGPPVVLVHGLSGQMGNFTHSLVDRLCGDFRVIAFDRPGSGYSTRSPKAPAGLHAQADTLVKAFRELKLERPLIVGHSLGGAVALAIALDHPDCVGGLALIAPLTHPVATPPHVFRALAIRSPLLRGLVAWTVATPASLIARKLATKEVFAPETAPADFASAGGGLLAARPRNVFASSSDMTAASDDLQDMPPRYPLLRAPIGILYGRGDHILNYRTQGEAIKEKVPSVDLELVDGGHMLPVTQPDLVAAFIRRIAAKTSTRESVN